MIEQIAFLVLGLGNGAVFGALALGVVMTYRSSGVVNFATGSIALYGAYAYSLLRSGRLLLLIPGIPSVSIGSPLSLWPALVIAVAMAALLGLLLYVLVFRPMRAAPPVARAVAALGVSLLISYTIAQELGVNPVPVAPIFPTHLWHNGSFLVSSDRVYFAITIVAVAVALSLVFRYTKFGLTTRAAAESERGAYLSGMAPDRIAAYNWIISSAIAGLSGILIAPIVPVYPEAYTLFIIPALAAAIVARFSSIMVAVVAGIVIGALQSDAQYLESAYKFLPSSGLPEIVPLILIVVVLVIRARPLPGRGEIILRTLGRAPRPRYVWQSSVLMFALAAGLMAILHEQWRNGFITSVNLAVIALSIVIITGYAGQVSLAQLAIAGAAGFILGPISGTFGVPFPIAPLLAAVFAAIIGIVIGLPALRIRGISLAIVTLTMAYAIEAFWFRNTDFVPPSGVFIKDPKLFGWDLGIGSGTTWPRLGFGIMCLIVLAIVAIGVALLRRSQLGSQMLALRANERAAAASGINVVRLKAYSFAIASFIAGLGGSLLAYQQGLVTYNSFSAVNGLLLFGIVYVAGVTSISGGLLAGVTASFGIVYVTIGRVFATTGWYSAITAFLLILTVIQNPEGVVGPVHAKIAARRAQSAKRRSANLPPPVQRLNTEEQSLRLVSDRADSDSTSALAVKNICVRYGGVTAVDGVSFDIPRGAIAGVIGPNGAGKTTLIDAISGFAGYSGEVVMSDLRLNGRPPHERIRLGLGRTFQALDLYDDLTVAENVEVGLTAAGRSARIRGRQAGADSGQVAEVFDLLGMSGIAGQIASELSQGQRQLTSIARALVAHPSVLLLDEPASGLDVIESRWLGETLEVIRGSGVTIILIDHDMSLVLGLCDVVHVLEFGELIASGAPSEVRSDRRVAQAYLGNAHAPKVAEA